MIQAAVALWIAVATTTTTTVVEALQQALTTTPPPTTNDDVVRYRARVAYHGAYFAGFQLQTKQKHQRTVQGVLEMALHQSLFGGIILQPKCAVEEDETTRIVKVVGAGRTDAGVHARGQVVHFDAPPTTLSLDQLQTSLDLFLPDDVTMWDLQVAPPVTLVVKGGVENRFRWSAIYQSTHKLYSYRIHLGPVMDPIDRHWRWHVPYHEDIDIGVLNTTLQHFVGTHDFRAFAASNFESSTSIKTVYAVHLIAENGNNNNVGDYRMEFLLQGALYKQVRNMVGAALEEARRPSKRRRDVNIARLLATGAPRQDNLALPAPPHGLTLEHVYYPDF
jgi:tRNA pseudouridine38-40 synthase